MRTHVILAVLKRNLMSYFSGVLGYLFIVVFVIAAAYCAFDARFFTNNLANLDQLTARFPYLLLFIVPAITMTAWADEKRLGTDELLFTLPASDFEIILGKYLALVLVYTVALLFSLTQVFVLAWFADPDPGLVVSTYFGYWLAGSALISAGMFASILTSSVTVAFVFGVACCALPVFVGTLARQRPAVADPGFLDVVTDFITNLCRDLSLVERLNEFSIGVVPLSGLLYFGSFIVLMLYLNAVAVGRRHWVQSQGDMPMGAHFTVRVVCLLAVLVAGNFMASSASEAMGLRRDLTSERVYTLSSTTTELIGKIEDKYQVTIQAFISSEVPREFVGQQTRLRGLLRQYDRLGGKLIEVRFVDVSPYSDAAEEAEHLGIQPNSVTSEAEDGRIVQARVFLGAVVSSPYDQVVIPFFDAGSSIEYELTRSIRTVSQKERLTVGILRTDANVSGGAGMDMFRPDPAWRIEAELKKQYKVTQVSADGPIVDEVDVMLAVMPSSLTQEQFGHFVAYVKSGKPTVVLDDPFPAFNPSVAPSQPKPNRNQGFMGMGGGPPPEQRAYNGTAQALIDALDIVWKNDTIVFDTTNPHPTFIEVLQPEFVFITGQDSDHAESINAESPITAGLQEVLLLFGGAIKAKEDSPLTFEPLLQTSRRRSGKLQYDDLFTSNPFFGLSSNPDVVRNVDDTVYTTAAYIHGEKDGGRIDVIFVADADIVSDNMFNTAQSQAYELRLDNVKFILNCVDKLAGDDSYLALRNRRPVHRTLSVIQDATNAFRSSVQAEREKAEQHAKDALQEAKDKLQEDVAKIRDDESLSGQEKLQKMRVAERNQNSRLEQEEARIDREKDKQLEGLKAREQREIRRVEDSFRLWAVLLPPVPAILLGIVFLLRRMAAEVSTIEAARRR